MSKKKLEELEKRIANLEKTPVRDMKAYCVGLSEYNSILDLKRIKKEYEAQMEELREIVCSDPIKVKGKSPDLGKSPVFLLFF